MLLMILHVCSRYYNYLLEKQFNAVDDVPCVFSLSSLFILNKICIIHVVDVMRLNDFLSFLHHLLCNVIQYNTAVDDVTGRI